MYRGQIVIVLIINMKGTGCKKLELAAQTQLKEEANVLLKWIITLKYENGIKMYDAVRSVIILRMTQFL